MGLYKARGSLLAKLIRDISKKVLHMIITALISLSFIGESLHGVPRRCSEADSGVWRVTLSISFPSPGCHKLSSFSAKLCRFFRAGCSNTLGAGTRLQDLFQAKPFCYSDPSPAQLLSQEATQAPETHHSRSCFQCPQTGAPQAIKHLARLTHSEGQFN